MDLDKRLQMAAESILENESLTEGLGEEAGTVLLNWGIAHAQQITATTKDIEDEDEAQEAIYPQMRGLRGLLRNVNSLCTQTLEASDQLTLLQEIADQVPVVYGETALTPDANHWAELFSIPLQNVAEKVTLLLGLVEATLPSE